MDREERHGRGCPVDWSWIVPPAASSATPVFHRYYRDYDQSPNFYRHPAPGLAADDTQAPPPEVAAVDEVPAEQALRTQGVLVQASLVPVPPAQAPPAQAPLVPAQASLRELPQPVAEPVALCPHRAGDHVPHLRMIGEQVEVVSEQSS
jgi:hypothetical protein